MQTNRRTFVKQLGALAATAAVVPAALATPPKLWFDISLAEWSLHKTIFNEKKLTNLDFPAVARKEFGIGIVEYVDQMFKDKARDTAYLNDLLTRCKDNDVKNHLIMVDTAGNLGEADAKKRMEAVEKHHQWVDCAKYLGCATIRVNARGAGTREEQAKQAADGLAKLSEYAAKQNINVIVENHGGNSSDGSWLASVMKMVNMPNCGTLPDLGNFCIEGIYANNTYTCKSEYDRYVGTQELMPFAKGVSAKTNGFDDAGNEAKMDYPRLFKIIKESGFRGIVGIEYEGAKLSEYDGIKATKKLLEKVGAV
ncbi:MAG: sugar phosphate isomerase/epimerase [Cytophagia bacterium]|nr:MAG: sugar phosphate isomerase/epimerase [Runella sp.]TAG19954.1 MAG: sugar phosphate isomerase/epimerase [Cytophagales bacterium]TAG40097.1 MAG: sugar phosphate isomerase/epimerase [Cytophagia bacterium]TAG54332.1 MAG: sugar phosphate isomerase/epimerase [Runella slithyformis]TAG80681.1 MAG: sugar phosphate isomerase/epimerase [Cytophagales bacterium]